MKRLYIPALLIAVCFSAKAQRVTYNHDNAKMNQVTVQETGAGTLSPSLYYQIFHNRYRKKANAENKMSYRTAAGIADYQQIGDAKKLDSAMVKRAEIEALNMADRQVDLAWLAEGKKVEDKLADFARNINRLMTAGGRNAHVTLWREHYNKFVTAINAIKSSYMPNSQRKKEYLRIYADINKANEDLIRFLVHLTDRGETARLLAASYTKPDNRGAIATAAMNRWRGAGWSTTVSNGNGGNGNGGLIIGPIRPIDPNWPFLPDHPIRFEGDYIIIDGHRYHKDFFIANQDKILAQLKKKNY